MSIKRDHFDRTASHAAGLRAGAQAELAHRLVNELMAQPDKFNPRRLNALGSNGFLVLMSAVRQHDVRESPPPRDVSPGHANAGSQASSWQPQRKPEPNNWLRSLSAGMACGFIIIAVGAAIAMLS
jgi:hypothetical protein